ncbi:MAG: hypothetical protein CVU55_07180 [Deltaproteobacteria bacterium HGW-Deltaproteobacteria-13]|jgi:hypothetical protein|nr:MAG: hypothetical protein CVU55_07180 [Deltaproteobacteria bacterium HGW-Deltaproteobacteria-13]
MTDSDQLFTVHAGKRIRQLLEDFEVVGTGLEIAIIPRYRFEYSLRDNIQAAIVASTMRLSSIDYAKKQYCKTISLVEDVGEDAVEAQYILAYKSAKKYIDELITRLSANDKPRPSKGVFGASLVLERLPYSFFSAHLLYELGHRYEGHAVSRLILEQIAWAHAAYTLDCIDDIKAIITTKVVSKLKKVIPLGGKLYGFLSKKTHLDYQSHPDFLRVDNSKNVILHTQFEFYEYAQIILHLADLFGIVWELSQFKYLEKTECIETIDGLLTIRKDRPFLKILKEHLNNIETAYAKIGRK